MHAILNRSSCVLQIAAVLFPLVAFITAARADIFQWEYINPADPSQGKQQSTILCPDGAGVNAIPGAILAERNLTMAYLKDADLHDAILVGTILIDADLRNANLSHVNFFGVVLIDAELIGAEVRGTDFQYATQNSFTSTQLYSTASYLAHDLTGIGLGNNDLHGWNFAGQNLTNADLFQCNLTNANLSGADTRGANFQIATLSGANISNLIQTDGHIAGLNLTAGASLVVRDYHGNPAASPPTGPLPIVVDQHLAMNAAGALRLVFEAVHWDSTISFQPGIPVTLGGTLDLTFAADVNLAGQIGRTIDLFDWTGVNPTGTFAVTSPYTWDLSKLYTAGEVTLSNVPGLFVLGDFNRDGQLSANDIQAMLSALTDLKTYETAYGLSDAALVLLGDLNGDRAVDNRDIQGLLSLLASGGRGASVNVPEPATLTLAAAAVCVLTMRNKRPPSVRRILF